MQTMWENFSHRSQAFLKSSLYKNFVARTVKKPEKADAQAHFLSAAHNEKYDQFKAQNPNYELLR